MSRPHNHRAFTLIEMLTTVAVLVIVLGLMVSLARHVRSRSAETLTRQLLARLEKTMATYGPERNRQLMNRMKSVPPLLPPEGKGDDALLRRRAEENIAQFVRVFRAAAGDEVFRSLPASLYDRTLIRDAWGTPVAYMVPGAANIEPMAPWPRAFFLSAGPDRRFSTTADNLYSYEKPQEP